MAPASPLPLTALHRRRLRELWRSAGWPCRDAVEIDLLAAGLLERRFDAQQRETLHLTDAGVRALAATLQSNRAAYNAHEALVARVAEAMQRDGRIVWRRLALRAALAQPAGGVAPAASGEGAPAAAPRSSGADAATGAKASTAGRLRWVIAMPDVYSIRHTTVEAYTEPIVHEIKVRRADLLADLRRPDKGAAYRAIASQCWYVLGEGVGDADDVPPEFGVIVAAGSGLETARPAPRRPVLPDFAVWMALARATAEPPPDDPAQALLAPILPGERPEDPPHPPPGS